VIWWADRKRREVDVNSRSSSSVPRSSAMRCVQLQFQHLQKKGIVSISHLISSSASSFPISEIPLFILTSFFCPLFPYIYINIYNQLQHFAECFAISESSLTFRCKILVVSIGWVRYYFSLRIWECQFFFYLMLIEGAQTLFLV